MEAKNIGKNGLIKQKKWFFRLTNQGNRPILPPFSYLIYMLSPIGFGASRDRAHPSDGQRPELRVIEGGKSIKETPPSPKETVILSFNHERASLERMLQQPGAEGYVQRAMLKKIQEVGIELYKQLQEDAATFSIEDLQEVSAQVKGARALVGDLEGKKGEEAYAAFMYIDSLIDWKKQLAATGERGQNLSRQANQMQQQVEQLDLAEIRRRIAQG